MTVKAELKKLGLHFIIVELGEVEILESITRGQLDSLKEALQQSGLQIIDDKRAVLIEKIKTVVVEMVHHADAMIKINFSDFLSARLHYDYTYMSNLFSELQGTTLEKYVISHKIEKIKEYIIYGELNMSEIAWKMNYSSVAHLSHQFKKATGHSPTHFKKLRDKKRSPIEEL
jgi:AraC-like DNA-binding protein